VEQQNEAYVIVSQFFITTATTLNLTMTAGVSAKLLFSQCYYFNATKISGDGILNGTQYIFDTGSYSTEYTHEIKISSGIPTNNFIIL